MIDNFWCDSGASYSCLPLLVFSFAWLLWSMSLLYSVLVFVDRGQVEHSITLARSMRFPMKQQTVR